MKTLRDVTLHLIPIVEPSTSLQESIELMQAEPLQTVALVGDEQYMGLFNAAALESNLIPAGEDLSVLAVGPYIHPMKVIGTLATPLAPTLDTMRRRNLSLIPIVEGAIFRGVVTRDDLEAAV